MYFSHKDSKLHRDTPNMRNIKAIAKSLRGFCNDSMNETSLPVAKLIPCKIITKLVPKLMANLSFSPKSIRKRKYKLRVITTISLMNMSWLKKTESLTLRMYLLERGMRCLIIINNMTVMEVPVELFFKIRARIITQKPHCQAITSNEESLINLLKLRS